MANGKPQPGDRSPWWDPTLSDVYAQVPREAPGAVQTDTSLRSVPGKQQPTSWFSVKTMPLTHKAAGALTHKAAGAAGPIGTNTITPWRVLMEVDPLDVWSADNGSANRGVADARCKPPESKPVKQVRCRKTCMRLTRVQKRLVRTWMCAYRFTYNRAVDLLIGRKQRGDPRQPIDRRWLGAQCTYLNEQLVYATKTGRTTRDVSTEEKAEIATGKAAKVEEMRQELGVEYGALVREHPWLAEVPSNIRKEACRDVAKAVKSNDGLAFFKSRSGKRHKWQLSYKKRSDDAAWTMCVPAICIRDATVEPRPETRMPRRDLEPHKQVGRRDWTRVRMCSTTLLGDVWLTEALPDGALKGAMQQGKRKRTCRTIAKDCRMTLDKRGRFHLVVPYAIEATPPTTKPLAERKVGANDPGDRVNATVCSPDDGEVVSYAIGKEGGGKDRICNECKKLDRVIATARKRKPAVQPGRAGRAELRASIAPLKRKRDHVRRYVPDPVQREAMLKRLRVAINALVATRYSLANGNPADSPSQRRTRCIRMAVHRAKAKDLVTEAHRKIALDLSRRYDTIILPPFNTSDMVKRKGRRRCIRSSVARSLMSWSHCQFRLLTKSLFLREGKEVLSPDERYTTMTCGACGILNVKHSNESWTCRHCNAFHQRDPAAARCIFIKPFDQRSNQHAVDVVRGRIQPTHVLDAAPPAASDGINSQ